MLPTTLARSRAAAAAAVAARSALSHVAGGPNGGGAGSINVPSASYGEELFSFNKNRLSQRPASWENFVLKYQDTRDPTLKENYGVEMPCQLCFSLL